jgi:aspartyl-tRNA(Asn)/glutamyl-tRNA(Gln) amidotransferase subunit C
MKVTDKDVAYVADLANLELTEEERARMLRDLNSILEYVERLGELETDKVPPMAQVSDRYGKDNNKDEARQASDRFAYAIREDVKEGLRKSLPHDLAVKNAPDTDGTFFEVPKVIER